MSDFKGTHWSKMPNAEEIKQRIIVSKTGKKLSPELCKKWSEVAKKYGHGKWMKGKKLTERHRRNIGKSCLGKTKGSKHYNWKGGIPQVRKKDIEVILWREAVMARDNWKCQKCGWEVIKDFRIHHILNYSKFPDLRVALDNGITFCRGCHVKFHHRYGTVNNTREQVNQFVEHT